MIDGMYITSQSVGLLDANNLIAQFYLAVVSFNDNYFKGFISALARRLKKNNRVLVVADHTN